MAFLCNRNVEDVEVSLRANPPKDDAKCPRLLINHCMQLDPACKVTQKSLQP